MCLINADYVRSRLFMSGQSPLLMMSLSLSLAFSRLVECTHARECVELLTVLDSTIHPLIGRRTHVLSAFYNPCELM